MDDTMGAATTLSTPQSQVDSLIQQVADENGLEIADQMAELQPGTSTLQAGKEPERGGKDSELNKRLGIRLQLFFHLSDFVGTKI